MIRRSTAWLHFVALIHVCSLLPTATAQDVEFIAAELGGVSVVSIPQPSPLPGLLATKVVLRTTAQNKLVTFENVKVTGAVHQVWIPRFQSDPIPTPFVDSYLWHVLPPEWIAADSHILISPSMVASGAGIGHERIDEANDGRNPVSAHVSLAELGGVAPAFSGIGNIAMATETDSFFLLPEFQTSDIEFVYITTPTASTSAASDVFLTVGVLGQGIINSGEPGGASFGFNGNAPVVIPFVPEPSSLVLSVCAVISFRLRRICFGARHL